MMFDALSLTLESLVETLEMVFASSFLSFVMGLMIAVLLFVLQPGGGMHPNAILHAVLSKAINIMRSFPFIILIILLMPATRRIVGTTIGVRAAVIPLSLAAAPFVARLIESAFSEIDKGLLEAARIMGSRNSDIIFKVLIPESLPQIVDAITMTVINLIAYSAMAGTVGAGGLGDLAIRYGYQRFRTDVMFAAVISIILIVEVVQVAGSRISKHLRDRR
ncbi:MAG TPA: methionine ABC transporter permease [Spirochaetaceae bacterium]|nr:methionine ABC transporter permease [Spirochaetaceae bacterium]